MVHIRSSKLTGKNNNKETKVLNIYRIQTNNKYSEVNTNIKSNINNINKLRRLTCHLRTYVFQLQHL